MNRCGALAAVTSTPGAAQVNVNALFTVNGVEVTFVVCVPSRGRGPRAAEELPRCSW